VKSVAARTVRFHQKRETAPNGALAAFGMRMDTVTNGQTGFSTEVAATPRQSAPGWSATKM